MSPNYIKSYVIAKIYYPDPNVFGLIRKRSALALFSSTEFNPNDGEIYELDAKMSKQLDFHQKAKLIFSSPPYLKVIKYGQYNWIRLWFLNIPHKEIDNKLADNLGKNDYLKFMCEVIESTRHIIDENGLACWVIGDVKIGNTVHNLAKDVWDEVKMANGNSSNTRKRKWHYRR